jgi:ABC-type lipoprotein release transport system permease subunit
MTPLRLIFRNLWFFRAGSLAVVLGMAVGTAVLAGSLMVGDSVRESLRKLAVERLGPVDYTMVAGKFFVDGSPDGLTDRLRRRPGIAERFTIAPGIITSGSAIIERDGVRQPGIGDVQILAFGGWNSAESPRTWPVVGDTGVVLNSQLAGELGVPKAGEVALSFALPSKEETSRESTIARRSRSDAAARLNVSKVAEVAPNRGVAGLFNLQGGQRTPKNAWVPLKDLQDSVRQPGRANVLVVHDKSLSLASRSDSSDLAQAAAAAQLLTDAVKAEATLADYGLQTLASKATGERVLWTSATYLDPPVVEAAEQAAKKIGISLRRVNVNLVNKVQVVGDDGKPIEGVKALHYAIGAGISALDDGAIADDEIVFNDATARQMGVKPGQRVVLRYFRRDAEGNLKDVSSAEAGVVFRVGRVIPMTGVGGDADLTPRFVGVTHTEDGAPIGSVGDWDLPAELANRIDKKVAEADNKDYWGDEAKKQKGYGPAPRMFISFNTARKLWAGAYGDTTSLRVPGAKGDAFEQVLVGSSGTLDPRTLGFVFQPIAKQQIENASGKTDFAGLFIGFSFFLIVAAVLLVAMLFRLNIEQRVRQFGVLAAVGFAPSRLRWLAMGEGAVLAILGGAIGVASGVAYTWVVMYGLRTWWVGAVGTTALEMHLFPRTLWAGFIFGFWVALMAVLWAVWRLGKVTPARLMSGQLAAVPRGISRADGRLRRVVGLVLGFAGIGLLATVLLAKMKPEIALGGGAILLAAGLTFLAGVLRPRRHEPGRGDIRSVVTLGVRNANRQTARSVLSVGLIAFAAFTLITVASMHKEGAGDVDNPSGGAGGFRLIANTGVPVLSDLSTAAGRRDAEFANADDAVWNGVEIVSLRRWAGQDISCLNLSRPTSPTILGVPPLFVKQNRFAFAQTADGSEAGWSLLERPIEANVVPVIADAETAAYILGMSVGDEMPLTDQRGVERKLRLVATLSHTIFQGEMLMGEANFRELFPAQPGYNTLLVACPAGRQDEVRKALNAELEDFAVSVGTTTARLEAFQEIQNTYLSTFRTLGSLGLALGTLGLAVVLVRNVVERRGELALMSALGFTQDSRVRMVLSENVLLLVLGLGVGTVCALLGVIPQVLSSGGGVAWTPLALTLLGVLALGLVASVIAVMASGARTTPRDLRRE